ncbi:MAG: cupin domain-containing protein [Chloracidobacterium sp.]|nr:cupin domain-containing protein [Chloracidobacterium sp.]
MKKVQLLLAVCTLICGGFAAHAQQNKAPKLPIINDTATEKEIRNFFDSYAEDLRQHRREAIANRYDARGYFRMGNGSKTLISFEDTKQRYLKRWTGPKSFAWRDLSIEVLSQDAVVVTGLFDWEGGSGQKATLSYTGLLIKHQGRWGIRVEDESVSPTMYTISKISGDRAVAGPFKETMTAQPGASIAAHLHTADMHIKVLSGRQFILMGDLSTARVQVYEAGSSFVIPAGIWHVEWFETESVFEISGIGPMLTKRPPSTPRNH